MINLSRVIQQYPFDLKSDLLKLDVSGATFDTLKQRLILPFSLKSSRKAKIDRAVAFYFCRYASFYGKGESYKKNLKQTSYLRKLDRLYCQRNFYYILKPLKATNGQVERLLSTHPFNGAIPYTMPLSHQLFVTCYNYPSFQFRSFS